MELKEFVDQVQNELPGHFSEKLKNADVSTAEVNKLQGQSYSGITIRPESSDIGMTIPTPLPLEAEVDEKEQHTKHKMAVNQAVSIEILKKDLIYIILEGNKEEK